MRVVFNLMVAALTTLASVGQAQTAAPGNNLRPNVIETFNVGDDTYVRALLVEPKAGALWVGTSKGVHEVDLATGKPRSAIRR